MIMSKIIQYLYRNPQLIPKFLKGEICLIGLNDQENQALVDVLNGKVKNNVNKFWR